MTTDPRDTTDGRGSLHAHVPPIDLPPAIASRVLATLESRGLVRPPNVQPGRSPARAGRAVRLAAAVALLAAGVVLGIVIGGSGHPQSPGRYVLLLYGDTPGDTGSVHVAREREYGRWASTLDGGARWVGGHELANVIDDLGPRDAVPSQPRERLAGYFVIDAPSPERAAEVARSCPHLKYGGRVVVMTIAS